MFRNLICFIFLSLFVGDVPSVKAQSQNIEWQLVFSDEFNQKNGTQLDSTKWSCSPRGWSTWNRWISDSKRLAFIRNGKLVCRAIRNAENPKDTALMLTGAVETRNKFSFQYGKIEVRAKTNLHEGNFPAIWLMPQPPAPRHPLGGEIDIFESYGTHRDACQTVHSHWTLDLKQNDNPKNTFARHYFDISKWHVYGVEWTPTQLIFLIDDEVTGVYVKSADTEALANGQWPFDHPFYIILNQSLGKQNAWYGAPDPHYVYETQFDWMRVYQKKNAK